MREDFVFRERVHDGMSRLPVGLCQHPELGGSDPAVLERYRAGDPNVCVLEERFPFHDPKVCAPTRRPDTPGQQGTPRFIRYTSYVALFLLRVSWLLRRTAPTP